MDDNDEDFDMLFNESGINDPSRKSEALFEQSFVGGESCMYLQTYRWGGGEGVRGTCYSCYRNFL